MTYHACLAYAVSWGIDRTALSSDVNNFIAATAVTLSAGMVSRFTGRQALGNTVAGLYVLLPGAYLVNEIFSTQSHQSFFQSIIVRAIIIGIGGWTGTILCSPTLFGTNRGLIQLSRGSDSTRRENEVRKNGTGALLFF